MDTTTIIFIICLAIILLLMVIGLALLFVCESNESKQEDQERRTFIENATIGDLVDDAKYYYRMARILTPYDDDEPLVHIGGFGIHFHPCLECELMYQESRDELIRRGVPDHYFYPSPRFESIPDKFLQIDSPC